jgi:hypothetical protein
LAIDNGIAKSRNLSQFWKKLTGSETFLDRDQRCFYDGLPFIQRKPFGRRRLYKERFMRKHAVTIFAATVVSTALVQIAVAQELEGLNPGPRGSIVGWGSQVVGVDLSHGFVQIAAGGNHSLVLFDT